MLGLTFDSGFCVMLRMKMNKFSLCGLLFVVGAACAITSCGSPGSGAAAWSAATSASHQKLQTAANTSSVTIPVLQSKLFEAKWGKPKIEVNNSGEYQLSYSDPKRPFNRLVIYGSSSALPALSSPPKAVFDEMVNGELAAVSREQSWRTVVIAGKTVRFFLESGPGGADGAYYSTEGFSLTDPNGKTGYYRLVVEAGTDEAPVRQRFASAKF